MGGTANEGRVALGEAGWFGLLLDEAVRGAGLGLPALPVQGAPKDFDERLAERLQASGVLRGGTLCGQPGPVFGRTEPDAACVELLRFQLATVMELVRARRPELADGRRRRLLLASLVGAYAGEVASAETLAAEAELATPTLDDFGEKRLLGIVGARLLRRGHKLETTTGGLPVHSLLAFLDARSAVRVAARQLAAGKGLGRRSARYLARLSKARALAAEALVSVASLGGSPAEEQLQLVRRQVRAVVLVPVDRRAALRAVDRPRRPAVLLGSVPAALREPLLEQMILASMRLGVWTARLRPLMESEATAAGLTPQAVERASVRAESEAGLLLRLPAAEAGAVVSPEDMVAAEQTASYNRRHAAGPGRPRAA